MSERGERVAYTSPIHVRTTPGASSGNLFHSHTHSLLSWDPPLRFSCPRSALPPASLQGSDDAQLFVSSQPRRFDQEHLFRDIMDADFLCHLTAKPVIDQRFPGVSLIAGFLLGSDMFALECGVRPPVFAPPISRDCLGKQLVPICRKLWRSSCTSFRP